MHPAGGIAVVCTSCWLCL